MTKASKILNTVNKGFEKIGLMPPSYNWSKTEAVDNEMVKAIDKIDEFQSLDEETFLYTSPALRRYSICLTVSNLIVTTKRIILWNSYWQKKYKDSLLPIISLIDINSIQRLKKERHWTSANTFSLSIQSNFITGNNPYYYFSSQTRKENIQLFKNQDDFKLFRKAIAFHGLEVEEI